MADRTCSIEGCERPRNAKGLCGGHYRRFRRGESLIIPLRHQHLKGTPLDERFWYFVDSSDPSGCWPWLGAIDSSTGYGRFGIDYQKCWAHRVSHELAIGPIPDGLEVDHLCRNRICVNPRHLEAVSHLENVLRGTSPAAVNAAKTHCIRGHPFSGDNLYITGRGARQCRTCRAAAMVKFHANA